MSTSYKNANRQLSNELPPSPLLKRGGVVFVSKNSFQRRPPTFLRLASAFAGGKKSAVRVGLGSITLIFQQAIGIKNDKIIILFR